MMITTVERPDANALRRAVLQAPQWYSSMKLPAVLDLIEQLDAKGHVDQLWSEAPLGEHLGGGFRLYAQLPSITSFTKDIRAIATHQYPTCVDLKNCYPTILMHMFPDILELKYYADRRDEVPRRDNAALRRLPGRSQAAVPSSLFQGHTQQMAFGLGARCCRPSCFCDCIRECDQHTARNRIICNNSDMYR